MGRNLIERKFRVRKIRCEVKYLVNNDKVYMLLKDGDKVEGSYFFEGFEDFDIFADYLKEVALQLFIEKCQVDLKKV